MFHPTNLALTLLLLLFGTTTNAFTAVPLRAGAGSTTTIARLGAATTLEPPTREQVREEIKEEEWTEDDIKRKGPLEYLEDDMEISRDMEDPFHILLMGSTFEKPKITVPYVSGSLEYVLAMPLLEATELSTFAKNEGMSCLGTWTREECLDLGKQLQVRDIVCRVVPFCDGGQRGWQAKDANNGFASSNSQY
jgi:hypothetical protein